jgi:hypothetical protein
MMSTNTKTAERAKNILLVLKGFKAQTLRDEDDLEFRYYAEGLIEAAILAIERLAQ